MTQAQMALFMRGYDKKIKEDAMMSCNIVTFPNLQPQDKKKLIEQLRN